MTHKPLVSIIVVNYNGGEKLSKRLITLLDDQVSPPFEVLFVDNASEDNSGEIGAILTEKYANLLHIKSKKNRGYAGGINLAWPHVQGKYVAVLNMDIRITSGWLGPLIDFCEANPNIGAVNPLILLDRDENRVNAIGQSVHVTALGFNRALGKPLEDVKKEPVEVSGIQGGAFVIRKQLIEEMGGLDEEGFLYHEDVDLSWLLLIKGYSLYCIPDSIVYHDYYLTMYPEKLYLLERNRLAMLLAYLQPKSLLLLSPWLLVSELLLWAFCILRGGKFLQAKALSYRWIYTKRAYLRRRKQQVEAQRKLSDIQILRKLSWMYSWDQFITLGTERGVSRDQPRG